MPLSWPVFLIYKSLNKFVCLLLYSKHKKRKISLNKCSTLVKEEDYLQPVRLDLENDLLQGKTFKVSWHSKFKLKNSLTKKHTVHILRQE